MQSGRGEQASDGTYRPLTIPREPQTPTVLEAHEGVVLPAQGEQWDGQTQIVQPAAGQPWGPPIESAGAAQPQQPATYPQASVDDEATQLIAPPGHVPPHPFEQEFFGPVPPMPEQPAEQPAEQPPRPPVSQTSPYAIRPGAPGDHPPIPFVPSGQQPEEVAGTAAATQQLPRFDQGQAWQPFEQSPQPQPQAPLQQTLQQTLQQAQQPHADYDFLYRGNEEAAAPTRPMPPVPPSSGGPQQPQHDAGPRSPRRKLSTRAVIGIAVAACTVVGLAVGAMLSAGGNTSDQQEAGGTASAAAHSSSSGGANAAAAQQAQSLDSLLGQSGSSRSTVINSVQTIKNCGNLAAAAADLRSAADQRYALALQLSQLSVDQLPHHAELVGALSTAWKASAAADEHYAQWADQMAKDKNGCRKGHAFPTPQMRQGNASSGAATYAKQQAAALWNPIAQQYGLTQRQYPQL